MTAKPTPTKKKRNKDEGDIAPENKVNQAIEETTTAQRLEKVGNTIDKAQLVIDEAYAQLNLSPEKITQIKDKAKIIANKVAEGTLELADIIPPRPTKFKPVEVLNSLEVNEKGDVIATPLSPEEIATRSSDIAFESAPSEEQLGFKPQVMLNGQIIAPIAKGVSGYSGNYSHEGQSFNAHWFLNRHEIVWPAVNIYKLTVDRRDVYLALCANSRVNITDDSDAYRHRDEATEVSTVLLVNASSLNDTFIGQNFLMNVETSGCVLNFSTIRVAKDPDVRRRMAWDEGEVASESKLTFIAGKSRRLRYQDSRFKQTTVVDCELEAGDYIRSSLLESIIRGARNHVKVSHSDVRKSYVVAARVELKSVNLTKVDLNTEGKLRVENQSLHDTTLNFSAIHMPDKFAFTKVQLVDRQHELQLMRTSRTEFELKISYLSDKFTTGDSEYDIRRKIAGLLAEYNAKQYTNVGEPNGLQQSLMDYLVDSVMSRLRLISTIDAALAVAKEVKHSVERYDSPYER